MATYSSPMRTCATCEYWDGPRNIKRDPKFVECPTNAAGVCLSPSSSRRSQTVRATTSGSSSCYQKWRYLK